MSSTYPFPSSSRQFEKARIRSPDQDAVPVAVADAGVSFVVVDVEDAVAVPVVDVAALRDGKLAWVQVELPHGSCSPRGSRCRERR
jgi:hypothetical protein